MLPVSLVRRVRRQAVAGPAWKSISRSCLSGKRDDALRDLSESQERMVIVKKGEEVRVKEIFEKWDLPYAQIGIVTAMGSCEFRKRERQWLRSPLAP